RRETVRMSTWTSVIVVIHVNELDELPNTKVPALVFVNAPLPAMICGAVKIVAAATSTVPPLAPNVMPRLVPNAKVPVVASVPPRSEERRAGRERGAGAARVL